MTGNIPEGLIEIFRLDLFINSLELTASQLESYKAFKQEHTKYSYVPCAFILADGFSECINDICELSYFSDLDVTDHSQVVEDVLKLYAETYKLTDLSEQEIAVRFCTKVDDILQEVESSSAIANVDQMAEAIKSIVYDCLGIEYDTDFNSCLS